MSEFQKYLYMVLYPNEALIASELPPESFAKHYAVGSPRHFNGKTVFAQIDIQFRNDYFPIDKMLEQTTSGISGVPKRTKFISSYRVLEHVSLEAIRKLFLVTVDGQILGIDPLKEYQVKHKEDRLRVYQEICPIHLLVGSNLPPVEFGRYVVNEHEAKGAPKLFFTQLDVDIEHILSSDLLVTPIHNVNPAHLKECIQELRDKPDKRTKTISLASSFYNISYSKVKRGLWIASGDEFLYFPMPSIEELEEEHYDFYRSVYKVYR